jgi:phytanoyl-CoA hydroxylase
MYIFKQPKIGGRVVPHQDSTFLWTDPPSVVGLWWALEDAHRGNGCLWALPGSHREPVARRMIRDEAGQGGVSFRGEDPPWDLEAAVPLEVEAGTLVVLHGQLVHFSHQNTSPASRHAYTMHVVEGGAGTAWSPENWLQRPADLPLEPLLRPVG